MPPLDLKVGPIDNGVAWVKIGGFLDAHTFETLESQLTDLFEQGHVKIAIDLSELSYISSPGIGVFVSALTTSRQKGGNLVMIRPPAHIVEIFDLVGLAQVLPSVENREEARSILADGTPDNG